MQTEALSSELRSLYSAGQWDSVLRAAEELQSLAPDRVPAAMLIGARHELERAGLQHRYRRALRALDAEDWPAAVAELAAVVAVDAGYEDARALLARAGERVAALDVDERRSIESSGPEPTGIEPTRIEPTGSSPAGTSRPGVARSPPGIAVVVCLWPASRCSS